MTIPEVLGQNNAVKRIEGVSTEIIKCTIYDYVMFMFLQVILARTISAP
jgi:hypothetical protein